MQRTRLDEQGLARKEWRRREEDKSRRRLKTIEGRRRRRWAKGWSRACRYKRIKQYGDSQLKVQTACN